MHMRVGFDAYTPWYLNGNSVYTKNLILALSRLKPDMELHLFMRRRRLRMAQASLGTAPNLRYRPCLLHQLILGPHLETAIRRLNDLIVKGSASKLDLFHCTNPANYPWGTKRVLVTLLDLIALRRGDWTSVGSQEFYRRHIRGILESALAITTISESTKSDLEASFPHLAGKTSVIHIAGNPAFRMTELDQGVLERYGISRDRRYLLFVGQYQPRKNIAGMLEAFSRLDEDIRREYTFVLAGSKMKQYMFEDIARRIDSFRSGIDIRMLVDVPDGDLLHLYNGAWLFAFLPFYEGFGVPVVEAMACGCPVLTSSASSTREVAAEAAVLVDPNDVDEISGAMERLLRDDGLRDDMARRAAERGRRFSWERTASETFALYQTLM
jgi:alpha-1,3-rhamnosyl/mannosyltransferase